MTEEENFTSNAADQQATGAKSDRDFVARRLAELQEANVYPRSERPPQTIAELRLERIPDIKKAVIHRR